jgi:ABC-type uncharacterized transport system involved in gliding motility auxiliary subunit
MRTAIANIVHWKYLKWLFWLSPALIIAGLSAGLVGGAWGVVPLTLLGIGVAIAMLWLAYYSRALPGFFGKRSTQAGTNALVATVAMVVILGLINFLGVRYTQQFDLTENQLFTLAPQTVEVMESLESPVKVWIFDLAPDPRDQALLNNYRRRSRQLSYEYVDPQANPGTARDFGVQTLGEVYVEQGDERRLVQTLNPEERLSERQLTNAIAQLSNPDPAKVYFLQGHGERPLDLGQQGAVSEAIARLTEENYVTEPLNLAGETTIPDDADVVIIASPQREFLEVEVAALNEYMEGQSGLMLLLDPPFQSGLEGVMDEWGVSLTDLLIIDPAGESAGLGPAVPIVTQYGNHPITQEFGNGISFYPAAQPINLEEQEDVEAVPILITDARTSAQALTEDGQLSDTEEAIPGPLTLGLALDRPVAEATSLEESTPDPENPEEATDETPEEAPEEASEDLTEEELSEEELLEDLLGEEDAAADEDTPQARVVVIGNSGFMADGLFNQQLNGDVFLNSVNWLSQRDDQTLSIRPKEVTDRTLFLSGPQQLLLLLGTLIFMPLVGFGMAIAVWWVRR